jgi:hypothetical protein
VFARQYGIDLCVSRSVRLGGLALALYVDVRNLTNRRNVVAVRKDAGSPAAGDLQIERIAEAAWSEHPDPIPYESPAYRAEADINGDGLVAGRDELRPMFERAARDFLQPLFAYGPPRLIRLGTRISW